MPIATDPANTAAEAPVRGRGQDDRFVLLDIARTVAALTVVLFHWHHFYFLGSALPADFDRDVLPLYHVFLPFYERGWIAVDFFFMLSGYIFFWKYKAPVSNRSIGARQFFLLRFSRLYPLHLATLLLVCLLQAAYFRSHAEFFVHPFNDAYHFFLQLFLASQWGFQRGPSFNDPVWSLSVEVILYVAFFLVARYAGDRRLLLLFLAVVGFAAYASNLSNAIGRGFFCFFIGGALAAILRDPKRAASGSLVETLVYLSIAIWMLLAVFMWSNGVWERISKDVAHLILRVLPMLSPRELKIEDRLVRITEYFFIVALLFPLLIAALVFLERRFHGQVRRFAFIGNISYSTYLIHFPLQLLCALLLPRYFASTPGPNSILTLAAFFVVLVAVSFCSFYFLERPAQAAIRRITMKRRPGMQVSAQRP